MSKAISFSDIKKASWLQGYNEIQMLDIAMDGKVNRVLYELGIDTEYGVSYYPAKHRNLAGEILVGFIACGEIQINRKHLTSVFSDLTDILTASAYTDPSLTRELAELSGLSRDYDAYNDSGVPDYDTLRAIMPQNQLEEGYEDVEKQLKQLAEICEMIRGPGMNASGAPKTSSEYKIYAEQRKGLND